MHATTTVLERPPVSQPDPISLAKTAVFRRSGIHRPPAKRSGFVVSWPVLFGVLAAAGTATVQPWKWVESTSISPAELHEATLRAVDVASPSKATTASVTLPGTLRPWQTAVLYARANGYVKAWHHDLGSQVRAGDLLVEIDTPELDQELAQGEGLAREAEAAVVQAQAERTEAEADLKVAESQLSRARAEVNLAQIQLVRREQLVARKVIVQEELDTAVRQMETRTAEVAAAESDVARRQANLHTRDAIIAARKSTAESRRSNVQRLQELQGFQRITAPFDGVITRRAVEVGMLVSPGSEPLYAVQDMSRIRVQVQVPQTYSSRMQLGVAAVIALPESSTESVSGTITRMADAVEAASRTMTIEIELANDDHRLQPGSYSQVTLDVPQAGNSWTIPANTVSMKVDGPHVVLVDEADRIELRRVTLGRDLGSRVVVAEGIHGGERLVVNPTDDLTNGLAIRVREAGEEKLVSQR